MNYKLITAALGIEAIAMHSNFFGTAGPVAKFNEEQLTALEAALAATAPAETEEISALNETITGLNAQVLELTANVSAIQESVTAAYETAGLEIAAEQNPAEAIAALGAKCHEYGNATTTHNFQPTDGEEKEEGNGLIAGYIDPKDEHNKFFNKQ